jgi:4-carboxymuconolactone decarboxylase
VVARTEVWQTDLGADQGTLCRALPKTVREVAILVTGAKFRSAYEIYAHVMIAERRGLSDDKIATIVAGQRPTDLARDEAIAYDVASALVDHGVLPELTTV